MVDEILKELEVFKGKILRTILSEENDAMLRQEWYPNRIKRVKVCHQ